MVKKLQKIVATTLFVIILVYPVKKHTDTISDLFFSAIQIVKAPLITAKKIQDSKVFLGFPDNCLEIIADFKAKLPNENRFFLGELFYKNPLISQRMIEFNFPMLFNKDARCGFVSVDEKADESLVKTIAINGGYKIVCHP